VEHLTTERGVVALLNQLIDLARAVKQIEWIAPRHEREDLEELEQLLVPGIEAIARIEASVGTPLANMVTPSARPRVPLGSSTSSDVVRERLVPRLRACARDLRDHAPGHSAAGTDFLLKLAAGLERHADALSR